MFSFRVKCTFVKYKHVIENILYIMLENTQLNAYTFLYISLLCYVTVVTQYRFFCTFKQQPRVTSHDGYLSLLFFSINQMFLFLLLLNNCILISFTDNNIIILSETTHPFIFISICTMWYIWPVTGDPGNAPRGPSGCQTLAGERGEARGTENRERGMGGMIFPDQLVTEGRG